MQYTGRKLPSWRPQPEGSVYGPITTAILEHIIELTVGESNLSFWLSWYVGLLSTYRLSPLGWAGQLQPALTLMLLLINPVSIPAQSTGAYWGISAALNTCSTAQLWLVLWFLGRQQKTSIIWKRGLVGKVPLFPAKQTALWFTGSGVCLFAPQELSEKLSFKCVSLEASNRLRSCEWGGWMRCMRLSTGLYHPLWKTGCNQRAREDGSKICLENKWCAMSLEPRRKHNAHALRGDKGVK